MYLRLGVHTAEVGAGVAVPEVDVAISSPSPTGQQAWLPWTPCQCLATHSHISLKLQTKAITATRSIMLQAGLLVFISENPEIYLM